MFPSKPRRLRGMCFRRQAPADGASRIFQPSSNRSVRGASSDTGDRSVFGIANADGVGPCRPPPARLLRPRASGFKPGAHRSAATECDLVGLFKFVGAAILRSDSKKASSPLEAVRPYDESNI